MRKLFLAMIASFALAVAACAPGAEQQDPLEPQPPAQPGDPVTPPDPALPGVDPTPADDMDDGFGDDDAGEQPAP